MNSSHSLQVIGAATEGHHWHLLYIVISSMHTSVALSAIYVLQGSQNTMPSSRAWIVACAAIGGGS